MASKSIPVAVLCAACRQLRAAGCRPATCTACGADFTSGHTAFALLRFEVRSASRGLDVHECIDLFGEWPAVEQSKAVMRLRELAEPHQARGERRIDTRGGSGAVVDLARWKAARREGAMASGR